VQPVEAVMGSVPVRVRSGRGKQRAARENQQRNKSQLAL
jgi:hypothetical protein